MNLQGKRAVITGGSSGIGCEIARQMAAKGARLVLTGRRPRPLADAVARLAAGGAEVPGVPGDVADEMARATLLASAVRLLAAWTSSSTTPVASAPGGWRTRRKPTCAP